MAKKKHRAEEIVTELRQVDVLMAQGRLVADAVRASATTSTNPSDASVKPVPETIIPTSEPLPRNANGKVLKRQLREWAAAQS